MRSAVVDPIVVIGCATRADNSGQPEAKQRKALRDHLVDLRLWEATGVAPASHRDAMPDALGMRFVSGGTSTLTAAQIERGLKATDLASAMACTTAP